MHVEFVFPFNLRCHTERNYGLSYQIVRDDLITNKISCDSESLCIPSKRLDRVKVTVPRSKLHNCDPKHTYLVYEPQPIVARQPIEPVSSLIKEQVFFDAWLNNKSLCFSADAERLFEEANKGFLRQISLWEEECKKADIINQNYWFENDMIASIDEVWDMLEAAIPIVKEILKKPILQTPLIKKEEFEKFSVRIDGSRYSPTLIIKFI